MRLRGRRVALLLASALPLLADEQHGSHQQQPLEAEEPRVIDNKDENNDDYFSNMPTKASDDIQHDIVQLPPSLENLDVVIVVPAGPQQQQQPQPQQQYQDSANDDSIDQDHMPSLQNVDVVVASEQNELEAEDTVEHHQEQQEENHHREQQFAKDDVSESHGSSGEELADSESFDQNDSSQRDGDSTTEIESDENDLLTTTEDSLGKSAKSIDNGESEDPIVNTQQEITDPQNDAENSAASEESAPDAESITSTNKSDDEEAARIAASHEDETSEEEEENYADRVSVDYASKSAGALIIEKSSSFKGTSNLLNSDKDKYAIAPCEDKKKVVLSLSEDILVKTIKLSNYERFSSTVKDFQVMGSQTLEKWVDLGTYTAKAGNGEQIFELSEPAWARYLKFKMLSHHGEEFYCTYSQIKVHGSTMVQGFHEQWEESNEEEENEEAEKKEAEILNGDGLTELADSEQPSAEGPSANGADSKAPSQGEGDDEGERKISNSIGGDNMLIPTEDGNNDENTEEKETYLPGSINSNPSIGKFYTSTALDGMLHGEIIDEVFLHEFLDLIPTTLSTLSLTSRESPGRRKKDADKRTPHQLGTLAVQSIYSSSRMAADAANAMVAAEGSGIIVAPKMTDKVEEMAKQYLGSDLPIEAFPCLKGLQGENMENVDPEIVPSCEETSVIKNSNVTEDREADVHGDIRESQAEETTAPQDDYSKAAGGTHESTLAAAASETKEILGAKRDENDGVAPTGVQLDAMDSTFAKMLENLPSAECLSKLNFAEFKSKMSASRKPAGGAGTAQSAGTMEPIFKKLTDEIKSLQTNLSIQEQFTKTSVACYQRVLLDSIIEIERIRTDQGDRLARLESAFQTSWSGRFLNVWRWFVHVVSSTIPQTWRWLFSSISATFLWTYSSLTVVHSWACLWLSTLVDFWLRVSRIALRLLLQFWPTLKNTLLSGGSATWFTTKFSPVAIHIDQLVERLSSHLSSHYQEEDFEPAWWAVPFVITVTVIFFCRLIMFCTSLMTRRGGSMSQDRRKLANQKQHEEQINPLVRQEREMAITQKQDEEHIPPLVDDETLSTMTKRGGSIRQDRRKLVNQKQHEEQINLLTRQEREMVITQKQDEQLIYPHS